MPDEKKHVYSVMLPMAGHLFLEVEANSEKEAIEQALATATISDLDSWEAFEQFNEGNVCYCPHPWEVEATDLGEVDDA